MSFQLPVFNDQAQSWGPPSDTGDGVVLNKLDKFRLDYWITDAVATAEARGPTATSGFKEVENEAQLQALDRERKSEAKGRKKKFVKYDRKPGMDKKKKQGGRPWVRREPVVRHPSITVNDRHRVLGRVAIQDLVKAYNEEIPAARDLRVCGFCQEWDDTFDAARTRKTMPMKEFPDVDFEHCTTLNDPIIREIVMSYDPKAKLVVLTTDSILATMMTTTRGLNSWDIKITKKGRFVFIDRRDEGSHVDTQWVSETADFDAPTDKDQHDPNSATSLAKESTNVCRAFAHQATKSKVHRLPNGGKSPFGGPGATRTIYRYRKFTIHEGTPDEYDVVVRCELDAGISKKDGSSKFVRAFAHLEYATERSKKWDQYVDNNRGALLASEAELNARKFGRWGALSVLSGADQMKIAFVSRTSLNKDEITAFVEAEAKSQPIPPEKWAEVYECIDKKDKIDVTLSKVSDKLNKAKEALKKALLKKKHFVVGVESVVPIDFATQISLKVRGMWGVLDTLVHSALAEVNAIGNQPVLVMRDPQKNQIVLFMERADSDTESDDDSSDDSDDDSSDDSDDDSSDDSSDDE